MNCLPAGRQASRIQFFDTLSGKLKPFDLPQGSEVKMYTCGPTVYDYAHIGNYRTFVFEDLLRRFLEFKGYKVKHVMNITDVDDKTIAGANREGKTLEDFTKTYLDAFHEDLKTLNILPPNVKEPRATQEIPAMLDLIQKLIEKKAAYVADGSVYYRVDTFKNYGKLSKKNLEKNIKGARVNLDEYDKEEGADFVLWKKSKEGEPCWDSPWGKGRPGWHIECSAMSMKYLGETFDIHAGGEDLIFPHHENEIAQSEAATGKTFVKYWLHVKHLLVDGKKMSKKDKNYYTLRDLLGNTTCHPEAVRPKDLGMQRYDPMAIRYALLSVHYKQQLNFTLDGLKEMEEVVKRMDDGYFNCLSWLKLESFSKGPADQNELEQLDSYVSQILESLDNDLQVAIGLSVLSLGIRNINRALSSGFTSKKNLEHGIAFFKKVDKLFGFDISSIDNIPFEILKLLKERNAKRRSEGFTQNQKLRNEADRIRGEIESKGWLVKDYALPKGGSATPGFALRVPSTVKKKRRAWDK